MCPYKIISRVFSNNPEFDEWYLIQDRQLAYINKRKLINVERDIITKNEKRTQRGVLALATLKTVIFSISKRVKKTVLFLSTFLL